MSVYFSESSLCRDHGAKEGEDGDVGDRGQEAEEDQDQVEHEGIVQRCFVQNYFCDFFS